MSKKKKHTAAEKRLFFLGYVLLLVLIDQISKAAAKASLEAGAVAVIPGVFELRYLENRGAAFGILQNHQGLFAVFAVSVTLGMLYLYPKIREGTRYQILRICCCLLAAGAVGNTIDRIIRGYVIDFLYVSLIHFPIFNIADIYVCCACAATMIGLIFVYRDDEVLQ